MIWIKVIIIIIIILSEELDINDVVIERAQRVKAYSHEKKNSKKLRSRTIVCKLLSFVDKARILKKSQGSTYYVNEDFSKETLAFRKELWEKVKALRKEGKVAYLNYKSIVVKKRNDPPVWINIIGLITMTTKSSNASEQ